MKAGSARLLSIVLIMVISGCESSHYYSQAITGHLSLMHAARPVNEVINDPAADPALVKKLVLSQDVLAFASDSLGMTPDDAYRDYVWQDRPHVVWNVVAADEFSVRPHPWCFPIAGCVPYRGYFDPADAQAFAKQLSAEGFDTHVGGVDAYSTLGWFDDPLLWTFTRRSDHGLAALLLHELAHREVYVSGDAAFNESFATLVEEEGLKRWLETRQDSTAWAEYNRQRDRHAQFIQLLLDTRASLKALYASHIPADDMRQEKTRILDDLKVRYRELKRTRWDNDGRYDTWFTSTVNNARLAGIATYHQWVPSFRRLLQQCQEQFPCLFKQAENLADLPPSERQAALERLLASARATDAEGKSP